MGDRPGPGEVVYGLHKVWVQNTSPASVMKSDPATDQVRNVIGLTPVAPGAPVAGAITVGDGALWSAANGSLMRIDPVSARLRSSVPVPRGVAVALGDGRVWVLSYPRSSSPTLFEPIRDTAALWQVNPLTGRVLGAPMRLSTSQPIALAVDRHVLWIADYAGSTVTRLRLTANGVHAHPGCATGPRPQSQQPQPRRR